MVEVVPGSPAAVAGLRPEDLIVAVDDRPVAEVDDVQRLMVGERIGAKVVLDVLREGRSITVELVPAELEYAAERITTNAGRCSPCVRRPRARSPSRGRGR